MSERDLPNASPREVDGTRRYDAYWAQDTPSPLTDP